MPGPARRVLVVDDMPMIGQVMAAMLERIGCTSVYASNGEEAWRMLAHEPFDLVMSDSQMPLCDGPELCRRLRAVGSSVPFVLMSGSPADRGLVTLAGATGFLGKPFTYAQLRETVLHCRRDAFPR